MAGLVYSISLIMAALCNRAVHYIFALWFLSFFLSSIFFPRLISAAAVGHLPYFHTWCGPSANEMCCTWLAGNTGRKKLPFWHHRTKFVRLYLWN